MSAIPVARVLDKLDEHLGRNDYAAAERHLNYWLAEAEALGDARGALAVCNELVGLHRKCGREVPALHCAETALRLAHECGLDGSITMGTTLINAATAYNAFGKPETALPLYAQAQKIYEALLPPEDARRGALYNNTALAAMAAGQYVRARELFDKAMDVMSRAARGAAECAITCCNLADLTAAEQGTDAGEAEIFAHLDRAQELLDDPALPHDGYYAFVCEKCAPTFGHYGYFMTEAELLSRAKEIYERA